MKPPKKNIFPLLFAASLFVAPAAFTAGVVVNDGFEKGLPRDASPYRLDATIDNAQAHSGRASLRLAKKPKQPWGTYYFDLDGKLDFSVGCEFSIWVYAERGANVTAYISADDGSSDRYTVVNAAGTIEPGKWCQLTGSVAAGDWRRSDRDFRLIVRTQGICWIDDITLRSERQPESPAEIWPRLENSLHTMAGKRVSPLAPGGSLVLDARNAVLAPDTALAETSLPADATTIIPAEGMLVFAIDAKDDLELTGTLQIEPDADLRPGLRVTVLSDDTVVAAPGVKAAPWKGTRGPGDRPGPAPDIRGERPSAIVPLVNWRMTKGRHYITVAGPHIRPGGTFAKLELRAKERPAEKPLYTFGLFSDTHLGFGRPSWMNIKLNSRTGQELESALRQLKRENADFAILAGDMTDGGRRSQYEELARAVKRANLPVYGCLGNHDTFADSRKDTAATIPKFFPEGPKNTDYTFSRPPLRFVVLDGSYWRGKDTPIQGHKGGGADQTTYSENITDWLRDTLAKDTSTPTIVVSHYQMYLRRGVSPVSGYDHGKLPLIDKTIMTALDAAPNVVATMNGHLHYNTVGTYHGITSIQNPAFVEWPNAYRVCRVYPDRMEWEVRQMPNRGLIREGVVHKMALVWMLSTTDDDLAGTINLAPRKPVETIIDENFENDALPDAVSTYRVETKPDTARAHSGKTALRVTTTGDDWGTVAFELDHLMDFNANGEFSIWVYAEPGMRVSSYISALAAGAKDRHTVANATGAVEPGKWNKLTCKVPAGKWRMDERDVRFIVRIQGAGTCWLDDASVRAVRPDGKNNPPKQKK